MENELQVTGAIVDSWVEPSGPPEQGSRLVLQVRPRGGQADELLIVEAAANLVPDVGWLEDLGENMCHGSPVAAVGRMMMNGLIAARSLELAR